MPRWPLTDHERFWQYVDKTDGCWEWTGATNSQGYGLFHWMGRLRKAHRMSLLYEQMPIPDSMEVDHVCRNRRCVRPSHLEIVTHAENMRRGAAARPVATHCRRGHEFTEVNTVWHLDGSRQCRVCLYTRNRENQRRYRAMAKKETAA